MAPSAVDVLPPTSNQAATVIVPKTLDPSKGAAGAFGRGQAGYDHAAETKGTEKHAAASYPHYLPVWDNETAKYPPLQEFEHYDHGKDADASYKNLLPKGSTVTDITASIGAEVRGVQISKLSNAGKDELARFVAEKKVVAFRDQDLADLPIQEALDWSGYFGRHHIHPTSGAPKGYPEIHLVHRGAGDKTVTSVFDTHINSLTWHSDVTYEKQPPGTTFLYLLDGPSAGGDTLFTNQVAAYDRLSPEFKKRLHGLTAYHSGHEQAQGSKSQGGPVRRDPVGTIHPLVRTHPVTGEKALFLNPGFVRYIVGYKKEESDALLKFLFDHIAASQDLQARVKWAPKTVVAWDNRVTVHSALLDWSTGQRRHLARITPQAEVPYETPFQE